MLTTLSEKCLQKVVSAQKPAVSRGCGTGGGISSAYSSEIEKSIPARAGGMTLGTARCDGCPLKRAMVGYAPRFSATKCTDCDEVAVGYGSVGQLVEKTRATYRRVTQLVAEAFFRGSHSAQ